MSDPMRIESPFDFTAGTAPLLVSMPHVGTALPAAVRDALTEAAAPLSDTDWHLSRLYDFVHDLGASVLTARYSRFAIDINRPSDDKPLYETATTGLYPDILFDGTPAFGEGLAPSAEHRASYLQQIWHVYHERIATELARIKREHGYAILFDAHSIASVIPRLFQGRLPDFNIGTASGASTDPELSARLKAVCEAAPQYTHVLNGRFTGGFITRNYGRPAEHIHAVQLELAQRTYMRESAPFDYIPALADEVRPVLRRFVGAMLEWGRQRYE